MPLARDAFIDDSPTSFSSLFGSAGDRKSRGMSPPRQKVGSNSLRHQKDLAVIAARFLSGVDVDRANLAAVLSSSKICSCTIVRVIKAVVSMGRRNTGAKF